MLRPYGRRRYRRRPNGRQRVRRRPAIGFVQYDDPVDVVGHDHIQIQFHIWEMRGDSLPT